MDVILPEDLRYQSDEPDCTLEEAVKKYKLDKKFIQELIDKKIIFAVDGRSYGGGITIISRDANKLKVLGESQIYRERIFDLNPSYFYDYSSDIIEYHLFHDFIDRFCWIIKLRYAGRESIKKKKFKLDEIFQKILIENHAELKKIKNRQKNKHNEEKILFHLKKGWYNELVRSCPLSIEKLNMGTNIKGSIDDASSISWEIIKSYYSIYEYINAVVYTTVDTINTNTHRKSSRYFTENIIKQLDEEVIFFPFSLRSDSVLKSFDFPKYLKFQYSSYPRNHNKYIRDLVEDVIKEFQRVKAKDKSENASIIDFLYWFRVWANYTGIETIVKLENGYLLNYLYNNLTMINFIVGGISELAAIARLGEEKYLSSLDKFSKSYILKHPQFSENRFLVPIFIRYRIYKHLGLVNNFRNYMLPPVVDPINFI